tara:strand:- start:1463 stop:2221 length:759 start_codon:yes stop_codon:yes gene_type:complete
MKKNFRILKFKNDRPIFEVKNISKSFNGRSILKKISLKVYPGELVSLFGPNGAGKSTLFNIAIGAENADSGEIFINKKPILEIPIHLRTKQGLGYLPQTRSLFNMSTYDNIFGLCQLHIQDPQKQKDETERLLDEFNLQHLRSLNASVLSGGEAKRLQLARVMINKPKIILIDEIFSMVDPIVVQEMQKYILKIQSMNVGCILTDHNFSTLFDLSDRNYCISDGSIIAEGTKNDLLKNSEAIKRYFGTSFDF